MDVSGILTTALTLTTIIAGGISTLLYGNTRTLRDSNQDLRNRVTDLENKYEAYKTEAEAKIKVLERDLGLSEDRARVLAEVVTGEAHLVIIEGQLRDLLDVINQLRDQLAPKDDT